MGHSYWIFALRDDSLLFAGSAEQLGHMLDKLVTSLEKGQCWLGILEHAMRENGKLRVQHCGPHCGDDELLTNRALRG